MSFADSIMSAPSAQATIQIACIEYFSQKEHLSHTASIASGFSYFTNDTIVSRHQEDPCKSAEVQALGAALIGQLRAMKNVVADTTPREGRSLIFGYWMMIPAAGGIIGPGLAAFVIERAGQRYTAALELVSLMLVVMFLYMMIIPESLPEAVRLRTQREDEAAAREAAKMSEGRRIVMKKIMLYLKSIFMPILVLVPGQIDTMDDDVPPMPHKYTLILLVFVNGLQHLATWVYKRLFFRKATEEKVESWDSSSTTKAAMPESDSDSSGEECEPYAETVQAHDRKTRRIPQDRPTDSLLAEEETVVAETASLLDAEGKGRLNRNWGLEECELETTPQTTWLEVNFFGVSGLLLFTSFIIVPLMETESTIFVSSFLRAMSAVGNTNFDTLLTTYAPAHQVAKILGGNSVVSTIITTIADLSFGWMFSRTSTTMPNFIFWIASLITLLSILFYIVFWNLYKRHDRRVIRQLKVASTAPAADGI
ncbi:hypothetical protein BGW41_005651 [Actinomortierella wolfii]|nr:hypothetical protein BGW41_005651 [Actinomortierella wolfii]